MSRVRVNGSGELTVVEQYPSNSAGASASAARNEQRVHSTTDRQSFQVEGSLARGSENIDLVSFKRRYFTEDRQNRLIPNTDQGDKFLSRGGALVERQFASIVSNPQLFSNETLNQWTQFLTEFSYSKGRVLQWRDSSDLVGDDTDPCEIAVYQLAKQKGINENEAAHILHDLVNSIVLKQGDNVERRGGAVNIKSKLKILGNDVEGRAIDNLTRSQKFFIVQALIATHLLDDSHRVNNQANVKTFVKLINQLRDIATPDQELQVDLLESNLVPAIDPEVERKAEQLVDYVIDQSPIDRDTIDDNILKLTGHRLEFQDILLSSEGREPLAPLQAARHIRARALGDKYTLNRKNPEILKSVLEDLAKVYRIEELYTDQRLKANRLTGIRSDMINVAYTMFSENPHLEIN